MGTAAEDKYEVFPPHIQKIDAELKEHFAGLKKGTPPPPPSEGESDEERAAREAEEQRLAAEEEVQKEEEARKAAEAQGLIPKAEFEKERQAHLTVKGKYDQEVPYLHTQLRFLTEQVQRLMGENEGLKKTKTETKLKTSWKDHPEISPMVTSLKSKFDPELVDGVLVITERAMDEQRRDFQREAEEREAKLRGEVSSNLGRTVEERFWDTVYGAHENYNDIQDDPEFHAFLKEPEGYTGATRHQWWMDAYNRRDARTFLRYINAFMATKKSDQGKLKTGDIDQTKLNNKLNPPRGTPGGGARQTTQIRTMTKDQAMQEYVKASEELTKLTDDVSKGLWDGREKEADLKEAELFRRVNAANAILSGSG